MPPLTTRRPVESDHADVVAAVTSWWGSPGPPPGLIPRLFFQHFTETSSVVVDGAELVAFLIGFFSQDRPEEAYIHFVGVAPAYRGQGIASDLYKRFFDRVREAGRTRVTAITSIDNAGSQAFHARMGFVMSEPVVDYDGTGGARVVFTLDLPSDSSVATSGR